MNWRNPFLNAYLAVTILGAALLGYLVYSSYSRYAEVSEIYDTKVTQLQRLQNKVPFPSDENNEAFAALTQEYRAEYEKLLARVTTMQKPVETITPQAFQDRLRAFVSEVLSAARDNGVTVNEAFYLGFDQYRNTLPSNEAAGVLARQLDAVRFIVDRLITFKVREILGVKRDLLPEEGGAKPQPSPTPAAANRRPRPGATPLAAQTDTPKIVGANAFDVAFVADQGRVRQALNAIVSEDQFFIIRNLNIQNSQLAGPKRVEDPTANPTPPPADPAAVGPDGQPLPEVPAGPTMRLLAGRETLTVALRVEMITFTPPASSK